MEIIDKTLDIVSRWATYAKEMGVRKQHLDTIEKTHLSTKKNCNNTQIRKKSKKKDINFTNDKA